MTPDPIAVELLSTTDASVWARRFMEIQRDASAEGRTLVDEGTMIGWFANAIETGRTTQQEQGGRQVSTSEIDADPLVEALARTILRHQLGCDQPAQPPAWMVAAATEIADVMVTTTNRSLLAWDASIAQRELVVELNRRHR